MAKPPSSEDNDKFQEDLQKAMALSLESHALEGFRQARRSEGQDSGDETASGRRHSQASHHSAKRESPLQVSTSCRSNSMTDVKARPRPNATGARSRPKATLPPPPPVRASTTPLTSTPCATKDLISLNATPSVNTDDVTLGWLDMQSTVKALYKQQPPVPNSGPQSLQPMPRTVFPTYNEVDNQLHYDRKQQQPPSRNAQMLPRRTVFTDDAPKGGPAVVTSPTSSGFLSPTLLTSNIVLGITKSQSWTGELYLQQRGQQQDPVVPPVARHRSTGTASATTSPLNKPVITSGLRSNYSLVNVTKRTQNDKKSEGHQPDSLIDLSEDMRESHMTKVSVLEAFDPLLIEDDELFTTPKHRVGHDKPDVGNDAPLSESSFYEAYDPFEYMVAKAQRGDPSDLDTSLTGAEKGADESAFACHSTPRHLKKHARHPSMSDRPDESTVERRKKQKAEYEKVVKANKDDSTMTICMSHCLVCKEKDVAYDSEVKAFIDMVTELRSRYSHTDTCTNPGIIMSPMIESAYPINTSVKLVVRFGRYLANDNLVNFTCDVTTSIGHIICKVLMDLEGDMQGESSEYILQVSGHNEFLSNETQLQSYEYVHQCYKFDRDVEFVLMPLSDVQHHFLRAAEDDKHDQVVRAEDLSPLDQIKTLSYEELQILLEYLEKESVRMIKVSDTLATCSDKEVMPALRPKRMIQAVKAVSAFLGNVETTELTEACEKLITQCLEFDQAKGNEDPSGKLRPEIVEEVGERYATVIISTTNKIHRDHAKQIQLTLGRIKDGVQNLIEIYTKSFRVNFSFTSTMVHQRAPKETIEIKETFLLRVCALHRLPSDWRYDDYKVSVQVYHGTRPIAEPQHTPFQAKTESFYERVVYDCWLESKTINICSLPRESRLVLTLIGREMVTVDKQTELVHTELGWASLQLFNFEQYLAQGIFLLNLWPPETEKQVGPAPDCGSHPSDDACALLSIELPELSTPIIFPKKIPVQPPPRQDYNFQDLDYITQQQLMDICDQDVFTFTEMPPQEREVLWEKRYYLSTIPGALPKVLLAAHSWEFACLPALYGLLQSWEKPSPMDVLQLFLPCFPDTRVRQVAIDWISEVSSDDLVDYLPQLLEALKHETWCASPLAKLMLERSLESPRVAHSLYWLLAQSLPGQTPQNTTDNPMDRDTRNKVARYRRRLQMLMRALYNISGNALRKAILTQQELLKYLNEAADQVKTSKESTRSLVLSKNMEALHLHLSEMATPIPLSLSQMVCGVDVKNSSYFPSNTLPLKLTFLSSAPSDLSADTPATIQAIYKVGDDLRQDQLTIQMIRVMDKLWLKEGLDLKMVTFACVPTGDRQGMVELVTEAKTLREIQVTGSRGVTGSFKDTPISDYLVRHNPSQLEFARAVNNFTRSCAGYSVVTYILGICDRHNDNIMVKQSGHLFHIDFGKFLGDAQMFGNFKRDRTPFVLTPDMLYVINGGDKPTLKFHDFVDICCKSFNIIRKHGNLLLNLFALMASSGIPGVTMDAVSYVQRALLPDLSGAEAAATFSRMIEESLTSWFTQWNFFIHNLGQLRFAGDNQEGAGELLSFIPKSYSMSSDGLITDVLVYGIQKRYSPEKHYVFILKLTRKHEKAPTYVFRTYKEFSELDSKLHTAFPVSGCHSLPKGLHIGRQEIQAVAEQRKHDIARFLESLFSLNVSISQSDLVYTFFHPLLRDQEDANIHIRKLRGQKGHARKSSVGKIKGQLKLTLEYRRDVLHVMVCHAKNLAMPDGSKEEPNSYVKVYLRPDPHKATKRKTRVVKRNCHPSFMEMLEYRMAMDVVRCRTLQATVWDCDRFQENMFLGAVTIPLQDLQPNTDVTNWYPLTNFHKLA